MFGFLAGLVYANAGEWFIHKYVLHGWGKKKDSFWSFHWKDHHRASRKNDMIDDAYVNSIDDYTDVEECEPFLKETGGLISLMILHTPLFFVWPSFTVGVWASIVAYYNLHKASHVKPGWAKKWMPWHYDHHMGKDQDTNWCVTWPLMDYVFGTRKKG